ncbi:YciI family protein [Cupriavidus basilensis]|uniref:YciI family protein n=1 Tax=Cupriavidus basilensis TaxID=68895 RepID=A0ABT6B2N2_9BURK|nr:YciI family protein [Cupriavidus basilensis]MDF3839135.1 YciI family protein [Cupriavidus basilensis]
MLYLILLRYRAPLAELDRYLAAHREFLHRHYAAGHFLLSGRQEPRVGGAILARGLSREEVGGWLVEDPFHKEGLADYEVIAWAPGLRAAEVPAAWAPDAEVVERVVEN